MAFQQENTALVNTNEITFFNFLTGQLYPPQIWTYKTKDSSSEVLSTDYFKSIGPSQFNIANNQLRIGDLAWTSAGDGNILMQVISLEPDVVMTQYSNIPPGSIGTNDLKNESVTPEKILQNSIGSSLMDESLIKYKTANMSAAQMNGAYAAPHLIMASPGAGKVIRIHDVMIAFTYGTAKFAGGGNSALQYGNTINGAGPFAAATILDNTFQQLEWDSNIFVCGLGASHGGVYPVASPLSENTGIYFSNTDGAFTGGTGCSMVFHIWYSVLELI